MLCYPNSDICSGFSKKRDLFSVWGACDGDLNVAPSLLCQLMVAIPVYSAVLYICLAVNYTKKAGFSRFHDFAVQLGVAFGVDRAVLSKGAQVLDFFVYPLSGVSMP